MPIAITAVEILFTTTSRTIRATHSSRGQQRPEREADSSHPFGRKTQGGRVGIENILVIYLFNDAVSSSDHTVANDRIINE
jgi:hypothetical protein